MTIFEKQNLYKFSVNGNNLSMRFDNVTLEFPSLFDKSGYEGAKQTYNTKVLISYKDRPDVYGGESSMIKDFENAVNIVATNKSLKKIKPDLHFKNTDFPISDGKYKADDSEKNDHYIDHIYFNAKEDKRPKVLIPLRVAEALGEDFDNDADELVTQRGSQVYLVGADSPNTSLFYSGCICSIVVAGYIYKGAGSTCASFYLKEVVLRERGERRGGGSIDDSVLEGFLD